VQARSPADLCVPHAVLGEIDDELARDAREGVARLEQRDGQVEVRQQLRLVAAARRRDEPRLGLVER
jgi:hypothetical protein